MIISSTGIASVSIRRLKMIRKKIINILHNKRRSLVKFTGLFVFLGIMALISGCNGEPVMYSIEESETYEESREAETDHYDDGNDAGEKSGNAKKEGDSRTADVSLEEIDDETYIVVHLCGAVNNPGVYELKYDSRVIDGIIKAGGFTEDAGENALNLAMPLTDGSKVYIPTVEEEAAAKESGEEEWMQSGSEGQVRDEEDSDTVNINTAGIDKLITLPGIGESRAKAIIAYREEKGAFKNTEDIMNVSGIKEASYSKIKDYIRVN